MKINKLILIFLLLVTAFSCFGQRMEVGVNGGASYYLGDINPGKHFIESDYTFGLYYRYNFTKRISLKVSGNYLRLHSADEKTKEDLIRNAWFKSDMIDISLLGEINFLPFFIGAKQHIWTPYLTGGFSIGLPMNIEGGFLNDEFTFNNEGLYSERESVGQKNSIIPNLVIGFGIKVSLSKKVGIHVEWVMHKTFVDWIDGIYYYDNYDFFDRNNILYVCNTTNTDWYSMFQLGLSYKFEMPKKKKCLEHLNNF
ncbi:MAG: DUF6089 family protein [Bacteroidales bacterium]|nr:DUF6089 family protein [Bacteroidales bacterium]